MRLTPQQMVDIAAHEAQSAGFTVEQALTYAAAVVGNAVYEAGVGKDGKIDVHQLQVRGPAQGALQLEPEWRATFLKFCDKNHFKDTTFEELNRFLLSSSDLNSKFSNHMGQGNASKFHAILKTEDSEAKTEALVEFFLKPAKYLNRGNTTEGPAKAQRFAKAYADELKSRQREAANLEAQSRRASQHRGSQPTSKDEKSTENTAAKRPAAKKVGATISSVTAEAPRPPVTYRVQSGDTLSGIAKATGVPQKSIMELNPQIKDPNSIQACQEIKLPHGATPPARSRVKLTPNAPQGSHTVVPNDTLAQISQKTGVAVDDIVAANPQIKDPNRISPGEQIKIPGGAAAVRVQAGTAAGVACVLEMAIDPAARTPENVAMTALAVACPPVAAAVGGGAACVKVAGDLRKGKVKVAAQRTAVIAHQTGMTIGASMAAADAGAAIVTACAVANPIGAAVLVGSLVGGVIFGLNQVYKPLHAELNEEADAKDE